MVSEKSKRRHDKDESSDARLSCGRIRSSDETAVIAAERRDSDSGVGKYIYILIGGD